MNQTITMGYTPAARASRALSAVDVRKMCASAISLARRKSLTLAVISAATCYVSSLLGNNPLAYTAAFIAIAFVGLADSTPKGGEL